jgi:trehalose-phosphatase
MRPRTHKKNCAPLRRPTDTEANTVKTSHYQQKRGISLRPELKSHLAPFLQAVAGAPQALLFVDYDGTLAPFQTERNRAYPYPGVANVLQEILRGGQTRVVVISGREAEEIPPLLNIHPRPEVWGCHGLQCLRTDGTLETLRIEERTIRGLSEARRWLDDQQLRSVAEFKTGSVAVHWRGLSEADAEELRARATVGWCPIAEQNGLNLLEFDGGLEILAREANKGDAVRSLLSEAGSATPAAYLGDDSTDESAFRAIEGCGLSVLVRPQWRQTAAQIWLEPPEELLEFLDSWLQASLKHVVGDRAVAGAIGAEQHR